MAVLVNSKWKRGEAEASPKYFDKPHPPPPRRFYVPACMSCCKWLNLLGVSKYKISNMTCIFTCIDRFCSYISEMTVQLSYSPIQFYHNHYIYFTEWLYFYYSFVSYLTSASKAVLHETSSNAVKLDKPNYV